MILPIVAFGDPVLKKEAVDIDKDYTALDELIANMFETMYRASGVGLAAPQIGLPIRLFIIDTKPMLEDDDDENEVEISEVFINARVTERSGEPWSFTEGCLSIPGIREDVMREEKISITYQNQKFETITKEFTGIAARVILHEYDHIDGILFTDHLKPLKKRMLKKRLEKISKGEVDVSYKMKFPNKSKKR